MLVGVMSDSHDHLRKIRKAMALFRERGAGAVFHAGDVVAPFAARALKEFVGPLHAVFGNNDGERAGLGKIIDIAPGPREISLRGRKIVIAHDAKDVPDALASGADLVITGHTHERRISSGRPMRLNPGEICGWVTGRSTCVVVDLETMEAETCDLGEP